jgi:hypothetical protein
MLKEKIQEEIKNAMRGGNEFVTTTLRMVLASITSKEKEKRFNISKEKPTLDEDGLVKESRLMDEEILDVISTEIKKRRDAIALYEKGGRQELSDKEKMEIEMLQKYLPEQLSEEDIKKIVIETIAEVGAREIKEMGKVMAKITPKVKGKAEGGTVSRIVKELLASK